ncbi:hypothetical protein CRENBAI_005518 [Crenichthys baileyi]|uniref:Uncharacterized protein n=1 Tax=Crenichthys baileyi TaxID=28760 RepID=A0AAV9S240_9TELE
MPCAKKNYLARKVNDLLSGLYSFYKENCVNRANLRSSFEEIGMKHLMPTRTLIQPLPSSCGLSEASGLEGRFSWCTETSREGDDPDDENCDET